MKKGLLFLSMGLLSLSGFAQTPDETPEPTAFDCVADTWIRENNVTWKPGTNQLDKVEIRMDAIKDDEEQVTGYANFVALYGFDYSLPEGMKVHSATLRLVSERHKGAAVNVYSYSHDFDEDNTTWETEKDYLSTAMNSTPVEFTPNGYSNKALGSDELSDEYKDVSKWVNEIPVTSFIKNLDADATRVNFLLTSADPKNTNQNCFYTKDTEDVENRKIESDILTFKKEDLIPVLYVTFVDENDDTVVEEPEDNLTADTFIRSNKADGAYGSEPDMEIYTVKEEDGSTTYFVGLLRFPMPEELLDPENEVKGVNLRLVTTQCKGDRNMSVYPFGYFSENGNWNMLGENVLEALNTSPVATFSVVGQGNKALNAKDAITDEFTSVNAWTNNIDLTDYVLSLLEKDEDLISILIAKTQTEENKNAVKFATREKESADGVKDSDGSAFSFAAEDIVPKLVMVYETTGVEKVKVIDLNAPVEYFDLSGRRVNNPEKGIFIMRQGDKAIKVIK